MRILLDAPETKRAVSCTGLHISDMKFPAQPVHLKFFGFLEKNCFSRRYCVLKKRKYTFQAHCRIYGTQGCNWNFLPVHLKFLFLEDFGCNIRLRKWIKIQVFASRIFGEATWIFWSKSLAQRDICPHWSFWKIWNFLLVLPIKIFAKFQNVQKMRGFRVSSCVLKSSSFSIYPTLHFKSPHFIKDFPLTKGFQVSSGYVTLHVKSFLTGHLKSFFFSGKWIQYTMHKMMFFLKKLPHFEQLDIWNPFFRLEMLCDSHVLCTKWSFLNGNMNFLRKSKSKNYVR